MKKQITLEQKEVILANYLKINANDLKVDCPNVGSFLDPQTLELYLVDDNGRIWQELYNQD